MDKLKIGMVGVGGFGGYRRERLRETGLFHVLAAYDLNPKALAAAQRDDGAQPMASYEELLAFPGLEAIVISTGAKFHAEQALAAAERGLHVFVEKPLCSTPAEVQALLDVQRRKRVVIGVGHHDHHTCGTSRTIKKLMDTGDLGKIVSFEATTCHSGGLAIKPGDWRGDCAKNPGGMLFQCGVHKLHELMFYFGPVSSVFCQMRYDLHTTQTADAAWCQLRFASGLVGTLNAYHVTPYHHYLYIYGTRTNLYLDQNPSPAVPLRRQSLPPKLDNSREVVEPQPITEPDDRCGNVRSFYHAVRSGGTPSPSLADGARAVLVVFAAEESAKTGQVVAIPAVE